MKQLICLENWPSLVKSGGICKTLSVLDWNVTMFLHFRPALQMLPNGRVLLSWAWLMYSHCMYLLFRRLKLLRAPGVSRDRMFFLVKFCKMTVFLLLCDQVQCKWLCGVRQIGYTAFLQQWLLLTFWYQGNWAVSISFIKQLFQYVKLTLNSLSKGKYLFGLSQMKDTFNYNILNNFRY